MSRFIAAGTAFFTALVVASSLHAAEGAPLSLKSARVSLDGTSNIHAYTATTTDVRVTGIELGVPLDGDTLATVLEAGALKSFDVVISAASLESEKGDLTKNMHKALKVQQHPDIRFRLRTLEAAAEGYRGTGLLTIAGVEKNVTLALRVERKGADLSVTGGTDLLMTDYGITPPKAMLGMLKTDPKVTIRIDLVLGATLS